MSSTRAGIPRNWKHHIGGKGGDMSVVNKMLRDLDARRVGEGERAALPAAVTPLAAHQDSSRSRSGSWLAALLAVVVLGIVALSARKSDEPQAPVIQTRNEAPPVPTPTATPTAAPTAAPAVTEGFLRMADELSVTRSHTPTPPHKAEFPMPQPPEGKAVGNIAPRAIAVVMPRVPQAVDESRIDKQVRLPTAAERAEASYRRGLLAQRQGNLDEAAGSYRSALDDQAEHGAARQALAALLIEGKHFDDAEELLRKGAALAPVRLASTLALARLKVERNQTPAALELLQQHAASGERSAEYQGFTGALLNRVGRSSEAVEHYQAAARLAPSEGRWWAGLGIALDAAGRGAEAREAYQKARALPGLPADLAQHVEQRLR